jgi:hypothetical protein
MRASTGDAGWPFRCDRLGTGVVSAALAAGGAAARCSSGEDSMMVVVDRQGAQRAAARQG